MASRIKFFLTCITSFLLAFSTFGQLSKGNWLVGGTGNFMSSKVYFNNINFNQKSDRIVITISPNIGYFVVNKLIVGLKPSYSKYTEHIDNNSSSNVNRIEIGPFVRYYFLDEKKRYNIGIDLSYQHGFYEFKPGNGNSNTFSASAGPVIYFNDVIGLEFLLGYYQRKEKTDNQWNTESNGFQIAIGFQISL